MSDFDALPPNDPHAEFALLATLVHGEALDAVWKITSPEDFYTPVHQHLAEVIRSMPNVDPTLVVAACRKHPDVQQIEGMLRLMPALVTWDRLDMHAELYARTVATYARRRALQRLGHRIYQQASSATADIDDVTIGVIASAEGMLVVPERHTLPSPTAEEFMAHAIGYDWLIPDLIERGDRIMVTGSEGSGKSTFTRQFAVCAAAGINPITQQRCKPLNVLLIDLENGTSHIQRKLEPLLTLAKKRGAYEPERLRIESKPAGIDLANFADSGWFTDKIAASNPDLVILGPLYRMHTLSLDKEDAARAITVILDGIRSKQRCALMVEAHAGHGFGGTRHWRPAGSSLFMRWPEFGLGIIPDFATGTATVTHWRGPRDERAWPKMLRRGGFGNWPWIETIAEAEGWKAS